MNTDYRLIKMFNCVVESNAKVNYLALNMEAMKRGYIITPAACNKSTEIFIRNEKINPNSTFYKTVDDIVSKSRFDLFIDQIIHYATTYGTNFEGIQYVPNENFGKEIVSIYKTYKVIDVVSPEEMLDRCTNMIMSGVAMSSATYKPIVDFIVEYSNTENVEFDIDIDSVPNKEIQVMLCKKLGILPYKPFNLLRYIMNETIGSFALIKNKETIARIKYSTTPFDFSKLDEKQLISLASIFYRYKELFLAFKKEVDITNDYGYVRKRKNGSIYCNGTINNNPYINKIRRLAIKYHKPLTAGFWETIISDRPSISDISARIEEANNFKIVSLINIVNCILNADDDTKKLYVIRNGKIFVGDTPKMSADDANYYNMLLQYLYDVLVERLSKKKCYVKYPDDMEYACPTSEKNFIGNMPFGTSFDIKKHNFIGVYWKSEWGTNDFDISLITPNGTKIGWNAQYYTNREMPSESDVIYSGDMTYADPEAAELMYFRNTVPNCSILLNDYSRAVNTGYRLFFGNSEEYSNLQNVCMIDPGLIRFNEECTNVAISQTLAFINSGRCYISVFGCGDNNVSIFNTNTVDIYNAAVYRVQNMIKLKDVLNGAGFVDVDTVDTIDENIEILDLTDINKDTLIKLFA